MKKILFLLLALFIVFYSLPVLSPASAQITPTTAPTGVEEDGKQDATESAERVDYALPYPGILPDNPLYFLKAARDRIIGFLINDPVKKAEFNLLTSDKRIYAAQLLADKGKNELAFSTLSKSNNYFHEAIMKADEAKKMGKNADTVLSTMERSVKKHIEAVSILEEVLGDSFSNQLQNELSRLEDFEKSVNRLISN